MTCFSWCLYRLCRRHLKTMITWAAWALVICLPSMSSDTGVRMMSPVNSHAVFLASIPEVPSNTWWTQNGNIFQLWPDLNLRYSRCRCPTNIYRENMKTSLNHSLGANDLQNLPAPLGPIRQGKVHNLCITRKLEEHDKDKINIILMCWVGAPKTFIFIIKVQRCATKNSIYLK